MSFMEKNRKLFSIIAAIVLLLALLPAAATVLAGLVPMMRELVEDSDLQAAFGELCLVLRDGIAVIPIVAFAVAALVYGLGGKGRWLFAVAAGVALVQQLLGILLYACFYWVLDFGDTLDRIYRIVLTLPGNLTFYLLFAFVLVFSLKKTNTTAASAVAAVVVGCLLVGNLISGGRTLGINLLNYHLRVLQSSYVRIEGALEIAFDMCKSVLYYGGLLLALPLALRPVAETSNPSAGEEEQGGEDCFAEEDDFAPEE